MLKLVSFVKIVTFVEFIYLILSFILQSKRETERPSPGYKKTGMASISIIFSLFGTEVTTYFLNSFRSN